MYDRLDITVKYSLAILKIVKLIGSTTCRLEPLLNPLMLKLMTPMNSFIIHKNLKLRNILKKRLKKIEIFKTGVLQIQAVTV